MLNEALLERVGVAMEAARAKGLVSGGLTASDVLRIPQVLEIGTRIDAGRRVRGRGRGAGRGRGRRRAGRAGGDARDGRSFSAGRSGRAARDARRAGR